MVRHGLRLEGRVLCLRARGAQSLEKEVEGLKKMVEEMMEKVTGLRVEDKGEKTEQSDEDRSEPRE